METLWNMEMPLMVSLRARSWGVEIMTAPIVFGGGWFLVTI